MADDISRVRRSRKALGIRWLYGQRMGAGRVGTRNQVYHRSRNRVDLATLLGRGRKNQFLGKVLRPVWRYRFPRCFARWQRRGDRKSTRLNSSHTVISYAVFCLKKKKTRLVEEAAE